MKQSKNYNLLAYGHFICIAILTIVQIALGLTPAERQARLNKRKTPVVIAVQATKDAVVNISTTRIIQPFEDNQVFPFFMLPPELFGPREAHSLGSGFVIHESGYIVTNYHVVQRASEITVSFADKTTAKVESLYFDAGHDLAVLKIKPPHKLHVLPLARGDDLMIGETVIAIGNPLGYQHTVTVGVVSAVGRVLRFRGGLVYRDLIQTDASINPGNSGGPLLDINGELIGINTAIRGDAQNIGFAISVKSLKKTLPELLDAERIRRINLGCSFDFLVDNRLRVITINANSPANRAGLQAGDLITGFDGKKLVNPVDFFVDLLERPIGRKLKITVVRNGKQYDLSIPFQRKPKPDGRKLAREKLGLILDELSPRQAQRLGLPARKFVVVKAVIPDTPAYYANFRPGDIIQQIGQSFVDSIDKVGQVLEQVKSGQSIFVVRISFSRGFINQFGTYLKSR